MKRFRAPGGKPGGVKPDDERHKGLNGESVFVGTVKPGITGSSGCVAWNTGKDHLKKHVLADGTCKFLHKCNQYVTDKGKGGQCLGDHKRGPDCDYPMDKRCKEPVKA